MGQLEVEHDGLVRPHVPILDEGFLVGDRQRVALVRVAQAQRVGDGLAGIDVVAEASERGPVLRDLDAGIGRDLLTIARGQWVRVGVVWRRSGIEVAGKRIAHRSGDRSHVDPGREVLAPQRPGVLVEAALRHKPQSRDRRDVEPGHEVRLIGLEARRHAEAGEGVLSCDMEALAGHGPDGRPAIELHLVLHARVHARAGLDQVVA